jgi:DNA-binding transcriptional LysR family regulator
VLTWDPANDGPLVENMFSRHDVPMPSKIHLAHSFSIAISLLRQTDMVSVFPWPLVELCAARERLCAFPLREQLEDAMVSVISRSGHPLSEASECFIDCLIGTIRDGLESPSQQTRNVLRSVELLI